MNDTNPIDFNDRPGTVTSPASVRLERLLPGTAERVWSYLTESDLREQWLAAGRIDLHVGGEVEHVFRNNGLTAGDDAPPARYAGVADRYVLRRRVPECDPPRVLAYTWGEESGSPSEVRFELVPRGEAVLLVITHSRLSSRDGMLSVSAGWHTHVAILLARLEGEAPPAFWRTFSRLEAEYDRRIG